MSKKAINRAGLGDGTVDGERATLLLPGNRIKLRWDAVSEEWQSDPALTFLIKSEWLMDSSGGPSWQYMSSPLGNPGQIGRTGFGWTPLAIHSGAAAYEAGFHLQEKLDYLFWQWDGSDDFHAATVFYDLNPTDVISLLISSTAADHIGTQFAAETGVRKMKTTGWVDSGIPVPEKKILAPHLYAIHYTTGSGHSPLLEFFTAHNRWAG